MPLGQHFAGMRFEVPAHVASCNVNTIPAALSLLSISVSVPFYAEQSENGP